MRQVVHEGSQSLLFDSAFHALTGHNPFPWQRELYERLTVGKIPIACDIPTGLGKTSVIAIWLLALAHHVRAGKACGFCRRLIYVVNRRTVVDQATHEAERMRDALCTGRDLAPVADALRSLSVRPSDAPLAISTLRGQFADNAEWRDDPARPAVIVGTVDMIGSRLLFSGYGRGFKSRPLHAGFLGQDSLLVHDEAHLEPAFQELIAAIELEQRRGHDLRAMRIMALTATARDGGDGVLHLSNADRKHTEVRKRIEAKKCIAFQSVDDEKDVPDQVFQCAAKYKDSGQAILVFLRKLEDLNKVADKLFKARLSVQVLTGTLRGLERDGLANQDPIFARFMPNPSGTPQPGTVYLVCTSAGEVGVNISADHLICDLTPFDSMAQRFGRVNRFGNGDAQIDIVFVRAKKKEERALKASDEAYEVRCEKTLFLLRRLPMRKKDDRHDASPAALSDLPMSDRQGAFTPSPKVLKATDVLFDVWSLTSFRQKLPGRPPVAEWLHGVAEWQPPETYVAWRQEVEIITPELQEASKPVDLLDDYPLKPHELIRDRTERVLTHLSKLADARPELPIWIVADDDDVRVTTLGALAKSSGEFLRDSIVLLPPTAGGLSFGADGRPTGVLDGRAAFIEDRRAFYDVADRWMTETNNAARMRIWDDEPRPSGMRLIRSIDTRPEVDEAEVSIQPGKRHLWHWYVRPASADDDGSRTAREVQFLDKHLESATQFARGFIATLSLSESEGSAIVLASKWHDLGKRRIIWQRSIGNPAPREWLAKSGPEMRPIEFTKYRHEFGSLLDVSSIAEFGALPPETQDLVLHLIGAHHGRARPHFPSEEVFDPDYPQEAATLTAREVPCRFARLQRKYGRWGLAYLESLVRAADALASQPFEAKKATV